MEHRQLSMKFIANRNTISKAQASRSFASNPVDLYITHWPMPAPLYGTWNPQEEKLGISNRYWEYVRRTEAENCCKEEPAAHRSADQNS